MLCVRTTTPYQPPQDVTRPPSKQRGPMVGPLSAARGGNNLDQNHGVGWEVMSKRRKVERYKFCRKVEKYDIPIYDIASDSITKKGARDYSCVGKDQVYEIIDNEDKCFEIFHVYDIEEPL